MPIRGFACAETQRLFETGKTRRFANIRAVALRKLDILNAASSVDDMRVPPGNMLEALRGDRAGQHSVRVNAQWRICFVWTEAGATRVEIVDYH